MKKRIILFVLGGLLMAACGKELTGLATELEVSPKTITFEAQGGEGKVYVTCDGFWNVYTNDRDWITVHSFGSNGYDSVRFDVAKNASGTLRRGSIIFNAGIDLSDTVIVLQGPAE